MNKESYIYLITGLALVGLWFFVIYVPYHIEKAELQVQIGESTKQLEDFKQVIRSLPVYLEKKKVLDVIKKNLNSKLYSKNNVLRLFDELKSEAAKRNMKITEITPPIEELLYLNSIIPDSSQPQFLNIGLRMKGDYISFGKFIGAIEKAGYFQGINICQIFGGPNLNYDVSYYVGFKALLGRLMVNHE